MSLEKLSNQMIQYIDILLAGGSHFLVVTG